MSRVGGRIPSYRQLPVIARVKLCRTLQNSLNFNHKFYLTVTFDSVMLLRNPSDWNVLVNITSRNVLSFFAQEGESYIVLFHITRILVN